MNDISRDFTPSGLKVEGPYENDRNGKYAHLYKDIIREVYGVQDVIIAHHLTYVKVDRRCDGFEYQVVEEIPAADTLIFDHDAAKKLWGRDYLTVLNQLSAEPVETRDDVLWRLWQNRQRFGTPYPK